jgi:hypothetical protein
MSNRGKTMTDKYPHEYLSSSPIVALVLFIIGFLEFFYNKIRDLFFPVTLAPAAIGTTTEYMESSLPTTSWLNFMIGIVLMAIALFILWNHFNKPEETTIKSIDEQIKCHEDAIMELKKKRL